MRGISLFLHRVFLNRLGKKLGQPVPESNFILELNSGTPVMNRRRSVGVIVPVGVRKKPAPFRIDASHNTALESAFF